VEILTVDPEHPDAEYCIAEPFADRWLEKVLA
jgi:hypothetical protein